MKRTLIIAGIIMLAAGAGWYAVRHGRSEKKSLESIQPRRGAIAVEFRVTGSVSPRNRLEIKPPVQGRIEEVRVHEGDRVRRGDTIVIMSSTERAALLDAARAKGEKEYARWAELYRPTPVVAPLDGTVIAREKEPGQTVTQSDSLIVMSDTLIIEAQVDETDLRYIRQGGTVGIFLDAYPDMNFKGVVEHVAYESQVVNNVTVYIVKIRPVNAPSQFRAGMTATVAVKAQEKENALLVPVEAVTEKDGKQTVLVASTRGAPASRRVETGITNGKSIEIVSGIGDGDSILIARAPASGKTDGQGRRRGGMPGMFR